MERSKAMKNPNQIRRNSNATGAVAQREAPTRRVKVRCSRELRTAVQKQAAKRGLTKSQFAAEAIRPELARSKKRQGGGVSDGTAANAEDKRLTNIARELPGAIYSGGEGNSSAARAASAKTVRTGPIEWPAAAFSEALGAGRFLITILPDLHRFELLKIGKERVYAEFLSLLAKVHLAELRDSVPLYWIEESEPERWLLISLRGELPPGCDPKCVEKGRKALAAEMKTRSIDRALCARLDSLEWIYRHGRPADIKATVQFLGQVCRRDQGHAPGERRCEMKRLAPNEKQNAQDALENEITKTFALLEVLAVLRTPINGDFIALDMITIDGLNLLAREQGSSLLDRFNALTDATGGKA